MRRLIGRFYGDHIALIPAPRPPLLNFIRDQVKERPRRSDEHAMIPAEIAANTAHTREDIADIAA